MKHSHFLMGLVSTSEVWQDGENHFFTEEEKYGRGGAPNSVSTLKDFQSAPGDSTQESIAL